MKSNLMFLIRLRSQWRRSTVGQRPVAGGLTGERASLDRVERWKILHFPALVTHVRGRAHSARFPRRLPALLPLLLVVFFAFSSAVALTVQKTAGEVSARLAPSTIAPGQPAELSVTLPAGGSGAPSLPKVAGLQIAPIGESSSSVVVNGNAANSITYLYQVTPTHAGKFTIPPISVGHEKTNPLVLNVLHKAPGNSSGSALPPSFGLVPPSVGTPDDNTSAESNSRMAFLRVVTPKPQLYVGESVPVRIKAYIRAGLDATLNGLPTLSSDAFTLNKLSDKPDETQEVIEGTPYTVLTWSSALSGIKAGNYNLGLDLPLLVRVREKLPHGRNPFRSMLPKSMLNDPFFDQSFFDDSFFDDFFAGVSEKPLVLKAEPCSLNISPLPASNRPAGFSGAVGKFEVSSEAAPTDCAVGDPITLRLKVSGRGNFDRVTLAGLPSSSEWKAYRPSARFEPSDSAGDEGAKTFEQAVVPLQAGAGQIPAFAFSYFDPDQKEYVSRTTAPIRVKVAAPATVGPYPSVAITQLSRAATPTVEARRTLAPDMIESGSFVSSLRPVFLSPWFIVLQSSMVGGLAVTLVILRFLDRLAKNPRLLRMQAAEQAVRDCLVRMDEAIQTGDRSAFFQAARRAVQEHLGELWDVPASTVTPSEIDRRLNGSGRQINTLFQLADRAAYGGIQCDASYFEQWKHFVTDQLKSLEAI